jgi:hypothetical protein
MSCLRQDKSGAVSPLAFGAVAIACGVGVALRLVQNLANTALWVDEIALVKGIIETDLWALLTRPLPFDQVAPKGFLLIQKLAILTLGPSDYVLRLFPFLCALGAVIVFAAIAWRILPAVGAVVATVLFATCGPLVAFSGLVKQYSTDVFAAVALTWFVLDLLDSAELNRRWLWAAFMGAILVWFSQPAVLVLAAFTPLLLWQLSRTTPANRRRLFAVVAAWGVSAAVVTAVSIASMTQATREYMLAYWADGFPPRSARLALEVLWPRPAILRLFSGGPGAQAGMGYPFFPLYPALAGLGYLALWFKSRSVALALVAPLLCAFVAAGARQYPFSDRLILYLVPSLLLAIAASVELLFRLTVKVSAMLGALTVVAVTLAAVLPVAATPPPYRLGDVKSLLVDVSSKRLPGDAMYVYYGAAPVMSMYASTFGLHRGDFLTGGCHRGDGRKYLEELDTFRGTSRVWVIVTHSVAHEREDILAYLDAVGTRLGEIRIPSRATGRTPAPAEAFLYDLSLTSRQAGVNVATFKLTGPNVPDPGNGCVSGPIAMIPSDFECGGPPETSCTRRSSEPKPSTGER